MKNKVSFTTDDVLNQSINELDQKKVLQLMQLQGECKIKNYIILKVNWPKAIILTLLSIASVVGLLFLVWYKWFRVKIWYSECPIDEATHVYVDAGSGVDDIEKIQREDNGISFYFKKLRYRLRNRSYSPVGFDYEQNFEAFISEAHLKKGLDSTTVELNLKEFGKNEHPVEIPNYFAFMIEILLKPFFLLQYLVCIAFFIETLVTFAVMNLGFSVFTTSINYILTYMSYRKIKDMAEKIINVRVLRDSQFIDVPSNMLVPGDLIDPAEEIMCDCIVVKGEIYVNEASLTGESVPIGKFSASKIEQTKDDSKWLFQGSTVVEKRNTVLALVVNTGYTTKRGRIIRKILTRVPKSSEIFRSAFYFLIQAFCVAMIIYFATIVFMKSRNISTLIVGFRFVDFLGWSFPPPFPIFFNLAYSFAIVRLKNSGILCIEPEKTVEACNLKIMCFDKTGTLTQNAVQVNQVLKFKDANSIVPITDEMDDPQNELIWKLFSTCHTTRKIEGKFLGDEIDVRMFIHSKYEMRQSQNPDVKFEVVSKNKKQHLEVLRINQYQSKFQSMSVLVRDKSDNKIYAFIKGAPEKIQKNIVTKINDYDKTVAMLSLGGYRTIAYAYRIVSEGEVNKYLEGPRQMFQNDIKPLGLVAFENKLKHDTRQTIDKLVQSGIEPKIITGDNIFIAVQTGVRAGIISANDKVIILEGRKQPKQEFQPDKPRTFRGILLTRHAQQTTQETILLKQDGNYLNQPYPMAIDNDFLKLEPAPALTPNIKLFARISTENKALIVTKFKNMLDDEYLKRTFISRLCGDLKKKVGMCGDGANDLMAIRSSDVGIGINESDASYAATFAIVNMLDVDQIIRDGKATTTNIVEMIRYYEFISFLKIPASLLLAWDTSYFNESTLFFFNFTSTIIYPLIQATSKPTKIATKAVPNGNLFGPINHLRFWGSFIIATGGLVAGVLYFRSTSGYIPNPTPVAVRSWTRATYSTTCIFLLILFPFAIYSLFFYIAGPWKQKIYKNWVLFVLIILNMISTVAMHYITPFALKPLGLVPIAYEVASNLLLISIAASLIGFIYNQIITQVVLGCCSDQKQTKAIEHDGE